MRQQAAPHRRILAATDAHHYSRGARLSPLRRTIRLTRRQLVQGVGVAGLGLLAGCGRLPGQAQPLPRVPRVGYLSPFSAEEDFGSDTSLRAGLRELGYIEGANLTVERRYAERNSEQLPDLAAELVRLP